jgi:hypothetical protein
MCSKYYLFNSNKNDNIYTQNNNIVDINTMKYNINHNIQNTNNNVFNINTFNYNNKKRFIQQIIIIFKPQIILF